MCKFKTVFPLGLLLLLALLFLIVQGGNKANNDHQTGNNYRFVNQKGGLVTITSRHPYIGDEIISAGGLHYRVTAIRKKIARVELMGRDQDYLAMVKYYDHLTIPAAAKDEWVKRPIAIYHTHSDESYLPSDGTYTIPFKGGIYQVGNSLSTALKKEQVNVLYDRTPHDPHDANAYYRSRRTAFKLLKKRPAAMFDVHRDGVDNPKFYEHAADRQATQLRLVVGRQNPKMAANLDFAKRLLAFSNKQNPKLVKEIYIAHGNYNQDLLSTALLIEAGTYTNEKRAAENGISLLAQSVPILLGLDPPPADQLQNSANGNTATDGINSPASIRQSWKTALFLVLLLLLALLGFTVLNNPKFKGREYLQEQYDKYKLLLKKHTARLSRKVR